MLRDILQFSRRLAQFYLTVDDKREDNLMNFNCKENRNKDSKLVLAAIGGDDAPISETAFSLSVLNVGERIASSSENYLLFRSNVKKCGLIVRRYVQKLRTDIKILEKENFTVVINKTLC